jgi:hypothetical protein
MSDLDDRIGFGVHSVDLIRGVAVSTNCTRLLAATRVRNPLVFRAVRQPWRCLHSQCPGIGASRANSLPGEV